MTTRTILVVPASLVNYNLDSDGKIWFVPSRGDMAGQRIDVDLDSKTADFVRFHAQRAGFEFDLNGLLVG